MSWSWKARRAAPLVLLAALAPAAAWGQGLRELQLQGLAIASRPFFAGAGAGLAWRDAQRTRWQTLVAVGDLRGAGWGARADLAWHFLLDPAKRRGSGVYGGAGMSVLAGAGRVTPYALLVFGVENAPGGSGGSFVEIGVGGGVRLSVGYRWRKRNAPGR
jgi:hypothetical protein